VNESAGPQPIPKIDEGRPVHLDQEPIISKGRIKRLRGMSRPQFRLRVDELRVFYDVAEGQVQVLAIVAKADANAWRAEAGEPHEEDPPQQSKG